MAKVRYQDIPLPEQRRLAREAEERRLEKIAYVSRRRMQERADLALKKWAKKAE